MNYFEKMMVESTLRRAYTKAVENGDSRQMKELSNQLIGIGWTPEEVERWTWITYKSMVG